MRLKSIGVLRGYAMGKTQLSKIADNIEHEVEEALEFERSENAKLRELARLLLWGIDNDMPRYEELVWSQKVNVLVRELGVEVDE